MKILFIGYSISRERFLLTKGASAAANTYQLGLLTGLKENAVDDLAVLTRLPIATYGASGVFYVRKTEETVIEGIKTTVLPMLNIVFFKQLWSAVSAVLLLFYWHRKTKKQSEKVVIQYNLNSFLAIFTSMACRALRIRNVYLFTDPPYSTSSRNIFWRVVYFINSIMTRASINSSSGIITVNSQAADKFAPGKPSCILEGGVFSERGQEDRQARCDEHPTLVYCGELSEYNGLEPLIDGFMQTENESFRLKIYGKGIMEKALRQRAMGDSRIAFMGFLPQEKIILIQKGATALVNPRPTKLEISRLTFPSKLMEYMVSGRPLLTTKLNGILPEYYPYMVFIDDESPKGFAQAIESLLGKSSEELELFGAEARKFVLENKNWYHQARCVMDFLKSLAQAPQRAHGE